MERRKSLRLILFMSVAVFIALAAAFVWGLGRDPSQIPLQLVRKPVAEFTLPPVQG